METNGLHVALVHRRLALGGAEEVSRQTAILFSRLGIHSHFFAEEHISQEWVCPDDPKVHLSLLPSGVRLWSKESAHYLLRTFKEQEIKVLIIPIALPNDYIPLFQSEGIKVIYWCHSSPLWERVDRRERATYKAHHPWYKNLYSVTLRRLRLALSSEEPLRTRYRRLAHQVDCFLTLAPGYIDEFVSALGLTPEEAERPKTIVFVGRLSYADKRPERVVRLWEKLHQALPEWKVEIYGKGPEEKFLRRLIQQKRLPRITLKGYISDPMSVYAQASVLLMTSTYEGWGLVVSEAQSQGVVPIAFDSSAGLRELLGADSSYGILVPPFDMEAYAAGLLRLCTDEELRCRLARAAIEHSKQYTPEQNASRWEQLFGRL